MEPISWSQPGHQPNPLGSFKNSLYLGSDPGQLHLILWGCGLGRLWGRKSRTRLSD